MVRSVALPVSQEGPPQPLIEPCRFASQWPRFKTPEGTNLETPIQVGRTHCLATIGSSDPPKLPNSQALASMLANANANANCMMTKPEAHIDSTSSDLAPVSAEAGMSCPAVSHNSKCFPIWQRDAESFDSAFGSRDETPYKTRPIRQAPVQQTLTLGPRSISLRWPDGIQHAVFYTDDVCHNVQVGRPEFTWHVERLGTQAVQCESPPAGLFKSVEFMEAEEYEEFSKRMRGQDAPGSKARWRSII
ncbi:MAG: hypothetical protein Q9203_007270 [Teloschistes exilis]